MKFETEELLREAVGDDQVRSRRALISKNATTGHGSTGTPSTCASRGSTIGSHCSSRQHCHASPAPLDDAKAVAKVAGPAGIYWAWQTSVSRSINPPPSRRVAIQGSIAGRVTPSSSYWRGEPRLAAGRGDGSRLVGRAPVALRDKDASALEIFRQRPCGSYRGVTG
jgi:hypothetical protein